MTKLKKEKYKYFVLIVLIVRCWSDECGDKRHRVYIMEQWYYYVVDELVPTIFDINGNGKLIYTTGCSMGATHAANFMFRRPDII